MIKKSGFTLAEVLITLGIIGVVAAMTIPTLMSDTNKISFTTGMKKMVSILSQAITINVALEGEDFGTITSGITSGDGNSLYDFLVSRLNVLTNPDTGSGTGGALNTTAGAANYTLYLTDGMAINFTTGINLCTTYAVGCSILIDVNGKKGPNLLTTGNEVYDQFALRLYNQQVIPGYGQSDRLYD